MIIEKNKILSNRLPYSYVIFSLFSLVIEASFAQEVVVGEDLEGRKSIRDTRFSEDVRIDGILDESIYESVEPSVTLFNTCLSLELSQATKPRCGLFTMTAASTSLPRYTNQFPRKTGLPMRCAGTSVGVARMTLSLSCLTHS